MVTRAGLAEGASSVAAGQAASRIESAGFRNVSGHAQGADGIWRGHADGEGPAFDAGFDFKGRFAFR